MGSIDETYSTILYLKFLQALLVCDNLEEFLNEADELGIDYKSIPLMEMFRDIVSAYTNGYSLPHTIEKNVIDFTQISRFSSPEEEQSERQTRFQVCNDIITSINQSKGKEEYPFYPAFINHIYRGFLFKVWNHFLYAKSPEAMKPLFDSYITIEYYILYSHTELLNDSEFLQFACSFLLNGAYLESIQFLLDEIPELERDPIFISRIRKILLENEHLLSEYQGNPIAGSETYLEDEDDEYIKDKYFWKLHKKVKIKLDRLEKDS